MATGFGLIPVRKKDGGELRVTSYNVPASDTTALYIGDVVELAATGAVDTVTGCLDITAATAGHALLGAVVGFLPDPTQLVNGHYRPASTARTVLVCDDPDAIFQVQEDAVGGSVAAADIGAMKNADIIVAAGSTATGLSGHMLDSNTATAGAANLKIVGIARRPGNTAAQSGGAILEVIIHEHALRTTDSVT